MAGADAARRECRRQLCHLRPRHGRATIRKFFPDDEGIYKGVTVNTGGECTYELQDSDIVCFRSAPSDADGYHSLVHTGGDTYEMPPLATVTLEKVQQPGEWEVRVRDDDDEFLSLKVQRRLLTVRVTWNEKCWWW